MILHTPLTMEEIFLNNEQKEKKLVYYSGKTCYAEETLTGELHIVQLISTNPNDYLADKFYPGQLLSLE